MIICFCSDKYDLWLCMHLYLVGQFLSLWMDNSSDNWCEYLDSALCAMNTSLENITMFGRNPLFPLKAEKEASIDKAIDTIPYIANCSW